MILCYFSLFCVVRVYTSIYTFFFAIAPSPHFFISSLEQLRQELSFFLSISFNDQSMQVPNFMSNIMNFFESIRLGLNTITEH